MVLFRAKEVETEKAKEVDMERVKEVETEKTKVVETEKAKEDMERVKEVETERVKEVVQSLWKSWQFITAPQPMLSVNVYGVVATVDGVGE